MRYKYRNEIIDIYNNKVDRKKFNYIFNFFNYLYNFCDFKFYGLIILFRFI